MEWKEQELASICDLQNGHAFKSKDYIEDSNTMNCRMSNIRPNGKFDLDYAPKYLPNNFAEKYSKYLLKDGDLIIAMTDMATDPKILGVPTLVETKGKNLLLNQRVGKMVFDNAKIDKSYLQYVLNRNSVKKYYTKFAGGGLQLNLGKKELLSVKIPLPPLPIQKKIAAILDATDEYRQKTKALLEKYDQLTQSIFLDMFGDPVRNEKGWEVKKMGNLSTKILSGNTPKGGKKVYVQKGITFFRSQNVWRNRIDLDDVAFIDDTTHSKMKNSSLMNGDILMTKTGRFNTENSSLGRAAMYIGEDNQANVNGHVYLIRLKEDILNEYVLYILTTIQFRDHIRRVCVGGIDKRQLNKGHLEDFPIIRPPIKMQNRFVEQLRVLKKQKLTLQENLLKSEELFQSLLQKAFKGELVK